MSTLDSRAQPIKRAAANPGLELLERLGYVARGVLYAVMGGLVAIGIAIGQFVEAYRAVFERDLKGWEMSQSARSIVVALGRFGMFARGVTFLVVGWFIVQAGLHHDPAQVQGFGGAFLFILSKPFGHLLLRIVALGCVALGLHSLACARWMRLMGSSVDSGHQA